MTWSYMYKQSKFLFLTEVFSWCTVLYVLGVQHSVSQFLKVSYDKPTQHIKKAETKNQKLFFFLQRLCQQRSIYSSFLQVFLQDHTV